MGGQKSAVFYIYYEKRVRGVLSLGDRCFLHYLPSAAP